ncbi:hypothetical protein [Fusibacter ferrireducens]|uniref:Uncharacterized protein n=1 Tax=Fusibacter ferrireducens TaxID=2785058 RepID=A0ABR9ZV08_9FIRM|nr:hypothetical protein [Fusibacter ferrireducens]MBF4694300.1 hypothetical protein [Fusibacter ferrireducens]
MNTFGIPPIHTPFFVMILPTLMLILYLVLIFLAIRFFIQFDRAQKKIGTIEHDLKEIKTYLNQKQSEHSTHM